MNAIIPLLLCGICLGAEPPNTFIVEGPKDPGSPTLYYVSKAVMQERINGSREAKKLSDDQHTAAMFSAPEGGRLMFEVEAKGEQEANPRNYEIQVTDASGAVIFRGKGPDERKQKVPKGYAATKAFSFDLPKAWEGSLKVGVYFSPSKKMRVYTIRPGAQVGGTEVEEKDPFARKSSNHEKDAKQSTP